MCTLILGRDVVSPASVLLWANRDEDPARPSDPPGILRPSPRLVGGRDRRSGGTWLAVRERQAVVAVLNRREMLGREAGGLLRPVGYRAQQTSRLSPDRLRSRGLLVLDVAGVPDSPDTAGPEELRVAGAGPIPRAAWTRALAAAHEHHYGPCTLLFAAPDACWLMALEPGREPRLAVIPAGWHVITHAELDDPDEPRTAGLLARLSGFRPRSLAEAEPRLDDLLRSHGDAMGLPPVCLHQGRMVTVSASSVWLSATEARYRHAEGRPCEHPFADQSALLSPAPAAAG